LDPGIGRAVEAAAAAWPARLSSTRLLGPAGFAALADNMLLMALLTSAPNTDIALERFLTMARAALLGAALPREITADDKTLRFAGAMAQQCFINEFIFMADETEIAEAKMLCETLAAALDSGEAIPPVQLLAGASYFPLMHLRGGERLLERSWPPAVQEVLTRQLREPLEERRLRAEIPRLTDIGSGTSQLVQRQYEENPYPRWVRVAPASRDNIVSFLSAKFPSARFERDPGRPMRDFLIAGCGTGQQSILAAQKFGDGHMLAVDLSLSSLGYARRKSNELGLKIAYGQADILELASLGRQFDVIECMGVLHHMADPYAGWKTLLALLRPNGFMEVGVYSAAARRPIHAVREEIAANGLGAADLRAFRQGLMPSRDPGVQAAILKSEDFFTTSACRDLLFHVQEQGLTIGGIKAFLLEHGLAFLGFELDDAVVDAYRRRFRDDPAAVDLDHWAAFEADHPGMFAGMYRFWIWKSGQS
ncbi:MAG TPA: class I SAM-dependent methyltransferase, partial [Rhizomicrobium sp.]|nr:class I SAM-dependent methyltransferase [Rhizomicrobium sp.]